MLPLPLQFLAAWLAVWLERVLQAQVDYLRAENRLLREKLGAKRLQLTDTERRRLAMLGKRLGGKGLAAIATIASPETILRWYRELVAKKYDGSQQRGQGGRRRRPKSRPSSSGWPMSVGATHASRARSQTLATRSDAIRSNASCWKMASTPHLNEGSECHGRRSSRHTWVRSSAWTSSP